VASRLDWQRAEERIRREALFPASSLAVGIGLAALLVPLVAWLAAPPGERRNVALVLACLSASGLLAMAAVAARSAGRYARLQGRDDLLAHHRAQLRARIRLLRSWPWVALGLVVAQLADALSWGEASGSMGIAFGLVALLAAAAWAHGLLTTLPRLRRELSELDSGGDLR
jgi:hypothetical protein